MKRILLFFFYSCLCATLKAQDPLSMWMPVVPDKIPEKYFPAENVHFTGTLNEHVIINLEKRLLQIDSAILLSGFEHRPGAQVWIGEHVGKFLFSASYTFRYTRDSRIKELMDDMVKKYIATQLPDGYLGTYLPKDYWTEWDVWAHKYAIIGLLNYYSITGYQPALDAAKKAGDLICRTFGDVPGKRDLNLAGWHAGLAPGSILEPMVDLYRYTADSNYLHFARYILKNWETTTGPKIMSGLEKYGQVTKVGNAKAYEMLSCFVGILKYYKLTGDKKYLSALQTAWNDIITNRLYITGTASAEEVFIDAHHLPAENADHMGEGCVTTTWMQFNEQLLKITGEMKYADEIEKSIYNHLFAAENPETGCVSYYTALQGVKPYRCDQGYSCCLSSVPRGISMIPYLVCGKINNEFAILLYEAGDMKDSLLTDDGSKIELTLKALADFPSSGNIKYRVQASSNKKFPIVFRIPSWSPHPEITVNGLRQKVSDKYWARIDREWANGDEVALSFDMSVKTIDGAPTYKNRVAFKRGPQILAMDSALNPNFSAINFTASANQHNFSKEVDPSKLPSGWIGKQAYTIKSDTGKTSFIFVPFADAGQQSGGVEVWMPAYSKSASTGKP